MPKIKIDTDRAIIFSIIGIVAWGIIGLPIYNRSRQSEPQYQREPAKAENRNGNAGKALAPVGNEKSGAEGETEREWPDYLKPSDWLLVLFTGLLTLYTRRLYKATAGLFTETAGLRTAADQQAADMKESIAAAKTAASAAQTTAVAAVESSNTARKALIAGTRPWVTFAFGDTALDGPLFYDVNGLNIKIKFVLRNVGQSPALNVHVHCKLIAGGDASQQQHAFCQPVIDGGGYRSGGMFIFGNDPVPPYTYKVTLTRQDIALANPAFGRFIALKAIGCIFYRFDGSERIHQSGFVFDIQRINREPPQPGAWVAIDVTAGDIPNDDLVISVDTIAVVKTD